MIDTYVYPNTNVLKNKFQETDPEKLAKLETKIVATRFVEYQKLKHTNFSFGGLKKIHKYLFADIYDWAGKERTVNIAKDNSMFCSSTHINSFAEGIFQKLKEDNFLQNLSKDDFCKKMADLYSDLNALHPFREGNGRGQALFIYHIAKQAGYKLDLYLNIDKAKMIEAAKQGMVSDNKKIREIISQNIEPLEPKINNRNLQEKFRQKMKNNSNSLER